MRAVRHAAWAALLVLAAAACQATVGVVIGEQAQDAAVGFDATTDAGNAPGDASPIVVKLGGDAATSVHGSPEGGMPFLDLCPDDEAVVGLHGSLTNIIITTFALGAIQATCASMAVDPSSGQVTTAPGAVLAIQGTGALDPWTQTCPSGQVVVGFVGRSGSAVDRAAFECASLAVDLDAGSFSLGPLVVLPSAGGDGGAPFQSQCPAGQVARGLVGRSGTWIDELGLVCASPALGGSAP
jgi:hypothetical protein